MTLLTSWTTATLLRMLRDVLWRHKDISTMRNEPPRGKTNKMTVRQRRLRSAWASAQSDQSSLYAHWVAKHPSFLHADSGCPGRSESSLGAYAILLVLSWGGSNISNGYKEETIVSNYALGHFLYEICVCNRFASGILELNFLPEHI